MAKLKETDVETDQTSTSERIYTVEQISLDETGGVVVYSSDAPDGTEFTAVIDGTEVTAKAQGGQLWFYVGRSLSVSAMARLV